LQEKELNNKTMKKREL